MAKLGAFKTPNELSRLPVDELLKEARRMFGAANKRINRLESADLHSPAYYAVMEGSKTPGTANRFKTGKFGLSGFDTKSIRSKSGAWYKERNKLINEMTRASVFLDDKTSTVSGAKSHLDKINKMFGQDLTYGDVSAFFDGYHKWLEEYVPAYNQERRYEYVEQYKAYLRDGDIPDDFDVMPDEDNWIEL